MNPCEWSMSVAALANSIACKLSDDDLELAAVSFMQLGETLSTIYVQRAIHKKKCCGDLDSSSGH